jgi:DNA-binding transcriptional regulator GbsR (MarR family)
MIVQTIKNGETEIRTEHAESLEDAKANGFTDGMYSRFFVNNKPVQNYMALAQFIVNETKSSGKRFVPPNRSELKKLQMEMIKTQNESIKAKYRELQAEYKKNGAPDILLKQLDEAMEKIDLAGVRVSQ